MSGLPFANNIADIVLDWNRPRNCGTYARREHLETLQRNDTKRALLKAYVLKTLEVFLHRLESTRIVKICAAGERKKPPLMRRVQTAIRAAQRTDSARLLLDQCKLVPEWKRECRTILIRLAAAIEYARELLRRRSARDFKYSDKNYIDGLWIYEYSGSKGRSSLHFLNVFNSGDLRDVLKRSKYVVKIECDEALLEYLTSPIHLPVAPEPHRPKTQRRR